MKRIPFLAAGAMFLGGVFPAMASQNVPFTSGFYVPVGMEKSCKDANFEVYDWVLRFDNPGRPIMASSEGVCNLSGLKRKGKGNYETKLECNSQGETDTSTMTFKVGGEAGKIIEIDGQPYSYCGPVK